jgi:DNA mismatch repair protein MutL
MEREETQPHIPGNNHTIEHSPSGLQDQKLTQVFGNYILMQQEKSFLLIHQQWAHERIIYERLQKAISGKPVATQQSLFPVTVELSAPDAVLLAELLPDLHQFGYSIEPFGKNAFIIQGTPADVLSGNEKGVLEQLLEQYKHFNPDFKFSRREMLLRAVAWQQSVKAGVLLNEREMQSLLGDLFSCKQPSSTPSGKPTYIEFKRENLEKMFNR